MAYVGAYPLPDDEDVEAIRAALAAKTRGQLKAAIVDRVIDDDTIPATEMGREIESRLAHKTARIVARAMTESWAKIRARVYERDAGVCHPCAKLVSFDEYECGHIVDRSSGGTDRDSNLVAMCIVCNRLKPTHSTRADYLAWVASGAVAGCIAVSQRSGAEMGAEAEGVWMLIQRLPWFDRAAILRRLKASLQERP